METRTDKEGAENAKIQESDKTRENHTCLWTVSSDQIYLTASDLGTGLFHRLDQSGDDRLSLREMRCATQCLRQLDLDGDGQVPAAELPTEIEVVLNQRNRNGSISPGTRANPASRNRPPPPKWFIHMDRNEDGDISPREFLGSSDLFRELDRNGDGFIEPAEAALARVR
jgi:hypothetical protein